MFIIKEKTNKNPNLFAFWSAMQHLIIPSRFLSPGLTCWFKCFIIMLFFYITNTTFSICMLLVLQERKWSMYGENDTWKTTNDLKPKYKN